VGERMTKLAAWYAVGRALAAKLNVSLMEDLTVIDFWRSAAGLRVAYQWRDMPAIEPHQETIALDPLEADRIMEMATC
jgi:hypothetical protein